VGRLESSGTARTKGMPAYNSGLMAGWAGEGGVVMVGRGNSIAEERYSEKGGGQRGRRMGLQGRELRGHFRWRLHELPLPVVQHTVPPVSAAGALVTSFFRARSWRLASSVARFSDLFRHRTLSLSLSLARCSLARKPPLSGAGPRCNETSHNGVTWPLLSRTRTPWS